MMATSALEESVRAASFASLREADLAVTRLLAAGFTKEEITVVCSDEAKERHFEEFRHQNPAGKDTPMAVGAGTSIGAVVGGLTAIAVGAATGAVPLIIAGASGIGAGSAIGGFLSAMLTRGEEKELANYYDQEIRLGRILVAVEVHGPRAARRLAQAADIFRESGAQPVRLPEG
ncbi:MAG TPA: hypothetical protein VGH74_01580 [Planctomycetaceae bacterium]|jgi:uncharacterized protein YcfJ